jgi:hypothetical protein
MYSELRNGLGFDPRQLHKEFSFHRYIYKILWPRRPFIQGAPRIEIL